MMISSSDTQLFKVIKSISLFDYYAHSSLVTKEANNIPHISWPNGSPCLLANMYMIALRNRPGRSRAGLSRRGSKGGTLGVYASNLSHLIRFCYKNKWDFFDLTDDRFTLFIRTLRAEKAENNFESKKRNETTITTIGRNCLDFMSFVGRFYGDEHFVSENGTIRGFKKSFELRSRYKKTMNRTYWSHHSLSDGGRISTRSPITQANIFLLKQANHNLQQSGFLTSRRRCLIMLLEHTGARVGELAELLTEDVFKADKMQQPMLRLITLKKGESTYRFVPVHKILLSELKTHIKMFRSRIMRRHGTSHDFFFNSETTGAQVTSETLGREIYILRKYAKISEQACAHMFRHAFITKLFVLLIERHEFSCEDSFRKSLISNESFKMEVMQWTGHSSPESLNRYIHLAFKEIGDYSSSLSTVHMIRAHLFFDNHLAELTSELESGMPIEEFLEKLKILQSKRDEDFLIAQNLITDIPENQF